MYNKPIREVAIKVVIVGGVAGGASCAARLRRLDERAEIVLVERGEFVSFANCGLPYRISGVIAEEGDLLVQTARGLKRRFNIDVRVRTEALCACSCRTALRPGTCPAVTRLGKRSRNPGYERGCGRCGQAVPDPEILSSKSVVL